MWILNGNGPSTCHNKTQKLCTVAWLLPNHRMFCFQKTRDIQIKKGLEKSFINRKMKSIM